MDRIAEGCVVTINATGLIVEIIELPVGPIGDIVSAVRADLIPFAPGIVVTLRHVTCLFAANYASTIAPYARQPMAAYLRFPCQPT